MARAKPAALSQTVPDRQRVRPSAAVVVSYRRRHCLEVMTEIAGGGQERWFAIFVAAIAGNGMQRGQYLANLGAILVRQRKGEQPQRIIDVGPLAQPRADNHTRNARLIEDVARRHVRDRDVVPITNPLGGRKDSLQGVPTAGNTHEAAVLHHRPRAGVLPVRLGLS